MRSIILTIFESVLLALTADTERKPPDNGQIACNEDPDCPQSWSCKQDSEGERCCVQITGSRADDLPPELADGVIIDPAIGKDDTLFTVCFSAKEERDQDPVVR